MLTVTARPKLLNRIVVARPRDNSSRLRSALSAQSNKAPGFVFGVIV